MWGVGILPEVAIMLTCGADKAIKLWQAGAVKQSIENAHAQAVRSITIISKDK